MISNDETLGMKDPFKQSYELKEPEPWTHIIELTTIRDVGLDSTTYHHVELDTTDSELVEFILKKVYSESIYSTPRSYLDAYKDQ